MVHNLTSLLSISASPGKMDIRVHKLGYLFVTWNIFIQGGLICFSYIIKEEIEFKIALSQKLKHFRFFPLTSNCFEIKVIDWFWNILATVKTNNVNVFVFLYLCGPNMFRKCKNSRKVVHWLSQSKFVKVHLRMKFKIMTLKVFLFLNLNWSRVG